MPKKTKNPKGAVIDAKKFNIFQTFFRATPNDLGFDWLQVIDGRPVMGWTDKEFKTELILLAMDL